jgi:hypothetical protein
MGLQLRREQTEVLPSLLSAQGETLRGGRQDACATPKAGLARGRGQGWARLLYAWSGHAGAATAPSEEGQSDRNCRVGDNAEASASAHGRLLALASTRKHALRLADSGAPDRGEAIAPPPTLGVIAASP